MADKCAPADITVSDQGFDPQTYPPQGCVYKDWCVTFQSADNQPKPFYSQDGLFCEGSAHNAPVAPATLRLKVRANPRTETPFVLSLNPIAPGCVAPDDGTINVGSKTTCDDDAITARPPATQRPAPPNAM